MTQPGCAGSGRAVCLASVLMLGLASRTAAAAVAPPARPNIVFIGTDDEAR